MDESKKLILAALSGMERPITISALAKQIGLDRHAVARHLEALEVMGKVRMLHIGAAKKYILTQSIPVSSLIDISSDLILILDSSLHVYYLNAAATSFCEIDDPISLIGIPFELTQLPLFTHPDIMTRIKKYSFHSIDKTEIQVFDRWFEITILGFSISMGNILLSVIALDITDKKQTEFALVRAQKKFESLFQLSPDPIIVTDFISGEIIEVNDAALEIFGYQFEEVKGKSSKDLEIWKDIEKRNQVYNPDNDSNRFYFPRVILYRSNKSLFCASVSARTLDLGEQRAIISVIRNISEQIRAETQIRESEKRYRILADNMIDVIWTMNLEGTFTYVSPSVFQLRGYTPEEVMQQSIEEVLCAGSIQYFTDNLKIALDNLKSGNRDLQNYYRVEQPRKDGTTVWTEVSARFLLDPTGNPIGVLGVSRDISERMQIEERIKQQALIISSSFDPIIMVNPDGAIQYWNHAAETLYKYTEEEVHSQHISLILPGESEVFMDKIALIKNKEVLNPFEMVHKAKDGRSIPVRLTIFPIYQDDEVIANIALIVHDIHVHKKRESELRALNEQLKQKNLDIMKYSREIEEREDIIRTLVDAIPAPVILIDLNERILLNNKIHSSWLNRPRAEIIGSTISQVLPENLYQGKISNIRQAIREKKVVSYEDEMNGKNVISYYNPVIDKSGEVSKIAVLAVDITEQKNREEQIRQNEEKFRIIAEFSNDCIWIIHPETEVILYVNPASREFGYLPEEVIGHSFQELIHPDDYRSVSDDLHARIREYERGNSSEGYRRQIFRMFHKNRDIIHVDVTYNLISGSDGKVSLVIGVNRDIYKHKKGIDDLLLSYHLLQKPAAGLPGQSESDMQSAASKLSDIRHQAQQAISHSQVDKSLQEHLHRIIADVNEIETIFSTIHSPNQENHISEEKK